jgi:hypothetical protein
MPSQLAWVDFAEEDRQRMLDVVSLFREQGTVDELGIGRIRDAFADHLFPGTSTIQTRARYMLLVPWIYLELEGRKTPSSQISTKARNWEVALINVLDASGDKGVIGRVAHKHLQRLPSSVYWNGLRSWGIRLFPGAQAEYHRYLDRYYRLRASRQQDDGHEPIGGPAPFNWDPGLPLQPDDLWESCGMSLPRHEAQYLHDKILLRQKDSFLAYLIDTPTLAGYVALPWQHPLTFSLPERLQGDLQHARNFSEAMHGAALLYNLLMARERAEDEWIRGYEEWFAEWAEAITSRFRELTDWYAHLNQFWQLPVFAYSNIPLPTRSFVNHWLDILFRASTPEELESNRDAANLIRSRELKLKGNRARLSNPSALKRWGGRSGDQQLDFRWSNASVIVDDIVTGLRKGE